MAQHPIPFDEERRQRLIDESGILDQSAWNELDRLTAYAAKRWNVPIATVSIVDRQRQFFKSCIGLDARETTREVAFCAHTIMSENSLVILDAKSDRRFVDNPLVTGEPGIRFYAGAPIFVDGVAFGTLCLIDLEPRDCFDPEDQEKLHALAAAAARHIERRKLEDFAGLTVDEQIAVAEAQQKAAERDRCAFIAMISHELRTPIGIVTGFSDLLRNQDASLAPAAREQYLRQIADGARQLQELTDSAIRFAAADFGRLPINEERFLIVDVLYDALLGARLRPSLDPGALRLLSDEFAELASDKGHMRQIFFNMFSFLIADAQEMVSITADRSSDGELILHASQESDQNDGSWSMQPIAPYGDDEDILGRGQEGLALDLALAERLSRALGMRLHHLRYEDETSALRLTIPPYLFAEETTAKATETKTPLAKQAAG
ncbi:MAG: GAF domain-containing protein [Pseudomonadota bacterium]